MYAKAFFFLWQNRSFFLTSNIICPVRTLNVKREYRWVDGHSFTLAYEIGVTT